MTENFKQNFYKYVTTPIAQFLDFLNVPKRRKLGKIRKKIAFENKYEYIRTTSELLLEQDLQSHLDKGEFPHPLLIPILITKHIDKATQMFYEKKKNGDFDELNIMLK